MKNSLQKNNLQKDSLQKDNLQKINNIKKIYTNISIFSLNDYNIYFCNTQYELYNLAIFSIIKSFSSVVNIPHIVCSNMEHPYIIEILDNYVSQNIITVSYTIADIYGSTSVNEIETAIKSDTCLIIVNFINRIIGTINNIKAIGDLAHKHKIPLFSDCIYIFGRSHFTPLENNIDIFSSKVHQNIYLLVIRKELFIGFKLEAQSIKFQNNSEKLISIDDKIYKLIIQTLGEFQNSKILSKNKKVLTLKKYLYNCLKKNCERTSNVVYYYDDIVKMNTIPKINDIVVLGHHLEDDNKSSSCILSFIYISSVAANIEKELKKLDCFVPLTNTTLLENMGILKKWAKRVITINLDNCVKADINALLEILFKKSKSVKK